MARGLRPLRLRAVVAAVLTTLLGVASVAHGSPAAATTLLRQPDSTGVVDTADTAENDTLDLLRLVDQQAAATGNGVYSAVVDVGDVAPFTELVVNVLDRVETRNQLRLTSSGLGLGTALATLPPTPVREFTRNPNGSVTVRLDLNDGTIPFEDGQVRLTSPGVYPVLFELRTPAGGVLDRLVTHLIRLPNPGELATLDVALALDVAAAPGGRPDGTIGFSAAARDRIAAVVDALDRHPTVPVTMTMVPETIEALTQSTDPADQYLGRRLTDPDAARLVLDHSYVRVDSGAMAAAGLDDIDAELAVRGTEVLTELLGSQPRTLTWVANDQTSPATIRQEALAGVREVIIPSQVTDEGLGDGELPLGPIDLSYGGTETIDAVVVDATLRSYFDHEDAILGADTALADLWLTASQLPIDGQTRGVIITPPDNWNPNPAYLNRLMGGLSSMPGVRAVAVDDIFDLDPALSQDGLTIRRQVANRAPAPLSMDLAGWNELDARLRSLDSMVVDDAGRALVADLREQLLPSFSSALTTSDRQAYWTAADDRIDGVVGGLVAPPSGSFTLTSQENEIPLRIRNDGPLPLLVRLQLSSDKLEFPAGQADAVVVPGGDVVDVPIDVRVKASGAFPVEVSVVTADGTTTLDANRITIRSVVLSGIGALLTVLALALLGVWWMVDHHRRKGTITHTAVPAA